MRIVIYRNHNIYINIINLLTNKIINNSFKNLNFHNFLFKIKSNILYKKF